MSTNPFDDAGGSGGGMAAMHHQPRSYYSRQQQQASSQYGSHSNRHNPASSKSTSKHIMHHDTVQQSSSPPRSNYNQQQSTQQQQQPQPQQPPIFSARGVEWPLPTAFNPSQYRKYRRESKSLGASLGILSSGLKLDVPQQHQSQQQQQQHQLDGGGDMAAGVGSARPAFASTTTSSTPSGGVGSGDARSVNSTSLESNAANTTSSGNTTSNNTTSGSGGYGGLTGLMGRVLGASSSSATMGSGGNLTNDVEEEDLNIPATRPILPPRAKCVAASNGWIVAAVECGHAPSSSSSVPTAASSSVAGGMMQSRHALTSLIPPLRMVSRWNVRRGSTLGSEGNNLIPLPPPVRATAASEELAPATSKVSLVSGNNNNSDPNFGRIAHTFVDPTGCHVILSAKNGEAYYLHSTSKKVKRLAGFGPHVDGTYAGYKAGMSVGDAGSTSGSGDAVVQTGLTPGSYITSVGWDRERGTEGSTKRILLGTSFGEIYEYALLSPNAASPAKSKSSPFDTKAGEVGTNVDEYGEGNDPIDAPVLLRRLNATSKSIASRSGGSEGGAVGGILFQRILTGGSVSAGGYVMLLISTGGTHRHTRLHTLRSEPSVSSTISPLALRSAFTRPTGVSTFVELPGSVEFAALCSCNDGFALRTETGIYYGTMERMAMAASMLGTGNAFSSSTGLGGSSSGGISDAGMLAYESLQGGSPASIGLTPHHFITLNSSANDVRFVNRVAKRIIQEERVDWVSVSQSSHTDSDMHGGGSIFGGASAAELLTDVRRPDQIWLRKGRSLVHISSSCEDRDVWKFTLARCIETVVPLPHHNHAAGSTDNAPLTSEEKQIDGQFEHASSLCSNSSQKAVVTAVRAEYHLYCGRVELAAKYMAQCPSAIMPFADTAVRLALPMLRGDDNETLITQRNNSHKANEALSSSNMALINYLSDKMRVAARRSKANDAMICTMLGTWLTELHLQERERDVASSSGKHRHGQSVNRALLHQFLSSFVRDMDSKAVLDILSSHDISAGECAGYSAAAGDIGAAVNAALSGEDEKNGALDALRVLNDSPIEKAEPYYYKHALTLLCRAPMSAAKSFVGRFNEGLSDKRLLPAFMHYEQRRKSNRGPSSSSALNSTFVDDSNASVRYLEGVIKLGSKCRAVFNYLTSLFASMEDEGPLFRFISEHVPSATPSSTAMSGIGGVSHLLLKQANIEKDCPLDKSFALRTILRTGRHFRSAVKLYMGFGMRQQAVELALKVDPTLARELARQSEDKDETKRLWLMIARNAAADNGMTSRDGKDVVARVVMVLKDCGPDILSIEDVLPFLPDFAQIDQFKDEICDALASYSSKIEHYLKEMNECDQTCDALRDELSRLKTVGTQVRADARCAFSNKHVMEEGEPFYAFPSGYVVLESALKREVLPRLNETQLERVTFIENELARLRRLRASNNRSSYELARDDYEIEELQVEMDGLIAAECPLTGSVMVDSIDCGFPGDEDGEF